MFGVATQRTLFLSSHTQNLNTSSTTEEAFRENSVRLWVYRIDSTVSLPMQVIDYNQTYKTKQVEMKRRQSNASS